MTERELLAIRDRLEKLNPDDLTPQELQDGLAELAEALRKPTLAEWLTDRHRNASRIALTKIGQDQQGWIEDAAYFSRALEIVQHYEKLLADGAQTKGAT